MVQATKEPTLPSYPILVSGATSGATMVLLLLTILATKEPTLPSSSGATCSTALVLLQSTLLQVTTRLTPCSFTTSDSIPCSGATSSASLVSLHIHNQDSTEHSRLLHKNLVVVVILFSVL